MISKLYSYTPVQTVMRLAVLDTIKKSIRSIFSGNSLPLVIEAVRKDSLTYLGEDALKDLYAQVQKIEKSSIKGVLIEAGCALGGSAIVIATAKAKSRPFLVYDVFGMIPPPSEQDGIDVHGRYQEIIRGDSKGIGNHQYYGYEENLYDRVVSNFRKYDMSLEDSNIRLIKGLFQDTLHVQKPVALAHIDGDWYDSVLTCLERIEPHLVSRGVLVIDDYYCWSGCRKAVDHFFANKQDDFEFIRKTRLHIIRK